MSQGKLFEVASHAYAIDGQSSIYSFSMFQHAFGLEEHAHIPDQKSEFHGFPCPAQEGPALQDPVGHRAVWLPRGYLWSHGSL